ncbi:MAG: TetR/AcrR family transcriptional regulator [Terriglobia bacterium]|jgi:TetR/AcrR family fatty acid metabolism transcriptional regulator
MARKENDKRREILQAAIRVFARSGFFNSKVSDVARRAGVADGTIYLYFRNKDDLLISLFDQIMSEFVTRAIETLATTRDVVEKLRRLAALHLDSLGRNRELAIVFQIELRHSSKFMSRFSRTRLADYFDLIRNVVREGQRTGRFRKELNEKIVTKCFFGALDEMVTNWILSPHPYNLGALSDPVVDLFVDGLEKAGRQAPAARKPAPVSLRKIPGGGMTRRRNSRSS